MNIIFERLSNEKLNSVLVNDAVDHESQKNSTSMIVLRRSLLILIQRLINKNREIQFANHERSTFYE